MRSFRTKGVEMRVTAVTVISSTVHWGGASSTELHCQHWQHSALGAVSSSQRLCAAHKYSARARSADHDTDKGGNCEQHCISIFDDAKAKVVLLGQRKSSGHLSHQLCISILNTNSSPKDLYKITLASAASGSNNTFKAQVHVLRSLHLFVAMVYGNKMFIFPNVWLKVLSIQNNSKVAVISIVHELPLRMFDW